MSVHRTFVTATLLCLSMGFSSQAQADVCDVDTDGDVDRLDLLLIIGARKTPASGPDDPRDIDGDGTITVRDARTCVRQCTFLRCAAEAAPPSPTDHVGQPDEADTTPAQKTVKDTSKPGVTVSDQLSTDIQGKVIVSDTEWKVKRGDTLYAISRTVYPGDTRMQARLRQDIIKLNPFIFANGANNMPIGAVLKLPDYEIDKSAPLTVSEPAHVPMPVEITPKLIPQPVAPVTVVEPEPEPEPEPVMQVRKESSTTRGQIVSAPSRSDNGVVVSLGYSHGGDELAEVEGWLDTSAGSGGHLRLGYEKMPDLGSGYRLAIGLQYSAVKDVSFRDDYFQIAYQYRANTIVYGIGVVSHSGATLESFNITTQYDAANGAVVYLESVGSGKLAGWGFSYTSLDIEERGTATSVDASRGELYYSWRF